MKPNRELYNQLEETEFEVVCVGDAGTTKNALEAIEDAYQKALEI